MEVSEMRAQMKVFADVSRPATFEHGSEPPPNVPNVARSTVGARASPPAKPVGGGQQRWPREPVNLSN